jgi:hypothetical protein
MKRGLAAAFGLLFSVAVAAQSGEQTLRIRGTIDQADAKSMVVKDRAGKVTPLAYADDLRVSEVVPIDPGAIQTGASSARPRCRAPTAASQRSRSTSFRKRRAAPEKGIGPSTCGPGRR